MSLIPLIHTVSAKLKKDEDEVFERLNIIFEVVKDEIFDKRRLIHYDIDIETINIIINELLRNNFISKYFSYDCEATDSIDFAISLNEKCNFCGEILSESENHIITETYKLNSNFIDLIKKEKDEKLNKYLMEDYRLNLQKLKDNSHKIIPFLGAGVSIPFNLPSWRELLLELNQGLTDNDKKKYRELIEDGDYLGALSFLKRFSVIYKTENQIKKEIKNIIKSNYSKISNNKAHNIVDIIKLESQFILTTNYDNTISDYLHDFRKDFVLPLTLNTINDIQELMDENPQRVIHLHGNLEVPDSMIVTEEDYNNLYNSEELKSKLTGIMSNKKFLFIGFSFKDTYFKNLYNKIYSQIGGEHFILVSDIHPYDTEKYLEKNLIPIGINVQKDEKHGYVKAIRAILEQLY